MRASLVALALVPRLAHAETEADLAAKGQDLAKDGRFSEAIDTFKAADKLEVRASHACLINDDHLWCWGLNRLGEVGNGRRFHERPVAVAIP